MYKQEDLFDLAQSEHALIFQDCEFAWDALKKLRSYLALTLRPALHHKAEGEPYIGPQVFIGEGTVVEHGAMIKGPAIIGRNCQIRHNAYIREDVIIGDDCVIGNACELKTHCSLTRCRCHTSATSAIPFLATKHTSAPA